MEKDHAPESTFFAPIFDTEPPPIDEENTCDNAFAPFASALDDGWGDFTNFEEGPSNVNWARFSPPPLSNSIPESDTVGKNSHTSATEKEMSAKQLSHIGNTDTLLTRNDSIEYSVQLKDAVLKDATASAKRVSPEESLFGLFYKDDTSSEIISANSFTSFENVYFKNDISVSNVLFSEIESDSNSNFYENGVGSLRDEDSEVPALNANQDLFSEFANIPESVSKEIGIDLNHRSDIAIGNQEMSTSISTNSVKLTSFTSDIISTNNDIPELQNHESVRDEKFLIQNEHENTSCQSNTGPSTKFLLPDSSNNMLAENISAVSSKSSACSTQVDNLSTVASQASEFDEFIDATTAYDVAPVVSDRYEVSHLKDFAYLEKFDSFTKSDSANGDYEGNFSKSGKLENMELQQHEIVPSKEENHVRLNEDCQFEICDQSEFKKNASGSFSSIGGTANYELQKLSNHDDHSKITDSNLQNEPGAGCPGTVGGNELEPTKFKELENISFQSKEIQVNSQTENICGKIDSDFQMDVPQSINPTSDQSGREGVYNKLQSTTQADMVSADSYESQTSNEFRDFGGFDSEVNKTVENDFSCTTSDKDVSSAMNLEEYDSRTVDQNSTEENSSQLHDNMSDFTGFSSVIKEDFCEFEMENSQEFKGFTEFGQFNASENEKEIELVVDSTKFMDKEHSDNDCLTNQDDNCSNVSGEKNSLQSNTSPEFTAEFGQFNASEKNLDTTHSDNLPHSEKEFICNQFGAFSSEQVDADQTENTFTNDQKDDTFANFSSGPKDDTFANFSSGQNDDTFANFSSGPKDDTFANFSPGQNDDTFANFSSGQKDDTFANFSSGQNDDTFANFSSGQKDDTFANFSSGQNDDTFANFSSGPKDDTFANFSSGQNDDTFANFSSGPKDDTFANFSSGQNDDTFANFSSGQKDDTFGNFSSGQTDDTLANFSSNQNNDTFANFESLKKSSISSGYENQAQTQLRLYTKCSSIVDSCFPSMGPDGNNRKRVYELKSHLNNTLKPDNDLSLWEEMKMTDNDEDRWLTVFFMSDSFRKQLLSFNIDHQVLMKMKAAKATGRLTPSLSPATSIGSLDTEIHFGILIPQQAVTVPSKNTLLAQSQTKKNIMERVPSLSSLKKESGSEPTSETASLDLDFFTNGVPAAQDSTGATVNLELYDIDFSNAGNPNVEKESSESDDVNTSPEPEPDPSAIQELMCKLNAKAKTQSPSVEDTSSSYNVTSENRIEATFGSINYDPPDIHSNNSFGVSKTNQQQADRGENAARQTTAGHTCITSDDKYSSLYQLQSGLIDHSDQTTFSDFSSSVENNASEITTLPASTDIKADQFVANDVNVFGKNTSDGDVFSSSMTPELDLLSNANKELSTDFAEFGNFSQFDNDGITNNADTSFGEFSAFESAEARDNREMFTKDSLQDLPSNVYMLPHGVLSTKDTTSSNIHCEHDTDTFQVQLKSFNDIDKNFTGLDDFAFTSSDNKSTRNELIHPVSVTASHDFQLNSTTSVLPQQFIAHDQSTTKNTVVFGNEFGGFENAHSDSGEFAVFEYNFGDKNTIDLKETISPPFEVCKQPTEVMQPNVSSITSSDSVGILSDATATAYNFADSGRTNENFGNFAEFQSTSTNTTEDTLHTVSETGKNLEASFTAISSYSSTQAPIVNGLNQTTLQPSSNIGISTYPSADEFTDFGAASDDFGDFATFDSAFPQSHQTKVDSSISFPDAFQGFQSNLTNEQSKPHVTTPTPEWSAQTFTTDSSDNVQTTATTAIPDTFNISQGKESVGGILTPQMLLPSEQSQSIDTNDKYGALAALSNNDGEFHFQSVDANDKYGALAALSNNDGDFKGAFSIANLNNGLPTNISPTFNHPASLADTFTDFQNSDGRSSKCNEVVSNLLTESLNSDWSSNTTHQQFGTIPNVNSSAPDNQRNFEQVFTKPADNQRNFEQVFTNPTVEPNNDFADFTSFVDSSNQIDPFQFDTSFPVVNTSNKSETPACPIFSENSVAPIQIPSDQPVKSGVIMSQPTNHNQIQFSDFSSFNSHDQQAIKTAGLADFAAHSNETPTTFSINSIVQPPPSGQRNVFQQPLVFDNIQTPSNVCDNKFDVFKKEVVTEEDDCNIVVSQNQSTEDRFSAFSHNIINTVPSGDVLSGSGSLPSTATFHDHNHFGEFAGFQGTSFDNFQPMPTQPQQPFNQPQQPFGSSIHGPGMQQPFSTAFHQNDVNQPSALFNQNRMQPHANPPFDQHHQYNQFGQQYGAIEQQRYPMHYRLPSNQPVHFPIGHVNQFSMHPANQNPLSYRGTAQQFPGQVHLQKGGSKPVEKPKYHPLPSGRDPFAMFSLQSNTKDLSLKVSVQTLNKHKPKLNEMVKNLSKSSGHPS